ncbi:hypothetical protein C0J52_18116, partial [Blattella germanica]
NFVALICLEECTNAWNSYIGGDISIPLALQTLEHSELYTRRMAHASSEKLGTVNMHQNMADSLCDYDSLNYPSVETVKPPALPPKKNRNVNSIVNRMPSFSR